MHIIYLLLLHFTGTIPSIMCYVTTHLHLLDFYNRQPPVLKPESTSPRFETILTGLTILGLCMCIA